MGRGRARAGALDDQFALELGEADEDREDQATIGGGGVDRGAFARQHLEADATFGQIANRIDEVAKVAPASVKLPDHERVIAAQRVRPGVQPRSLLEPARRCILIDMLRIDAGRGQRVALDRCSVGRRIKGHGPPLDEMRRPVAHARLDELVAGHGGKEMNHLDRRIKRPDGERVRIDQ
jgi:hypothetical protein